jgi:hypothetical protein
MHRHKPDFVDGLRFSDTKIMNIEVLHSFIQTGLAGGQVGQTCHVPMASSCISRSRRNPSLAESLDVWSGCKFGGGA